jgi:hypothetical protein
MASQTKQVRATFALKRLLLNVVRMNPRNQGMSRQQVLAGRAFLEQLRQNANATQ